MSTELTSWGPLCQATIVTFHPFEMAFKLLLYGLLVSASVKVLASVAKAFLSFRSLAVANKPSQALTVIAKRHRFPVSKIITINNSQLIAFASIMPFISNGIFISLGACRSLTKKQLEAVFLHELHHWSNRDPLIQLGLKIMTEVCFFIPSIRDILNHWQLQAELKADAYVVKQLGSSKPLRQALDRWLTLTPQQTTPAWAMTFAETQLGARIQKLTSLPNALPSSLPNNNSAKKLSLVVGRLVVSVLVLVGLSILPTTHFSKAEAQLIIPTSSQCSSPWSVEGPQSSIFTVMSHQ